MAAPDVARAAAGPSRPRAPAAGGGAPRRADVARAAARARGVHTSPPSSISACAYSPGSAVGDSPATANRAAAARISGRAFGNGVSMPKSRAITRSTLPSTTVAAWPWAMAEMAAAVYAPMPGSARNSRSVMGSAPALLSTSSLAHAWRLRARA